MKKLKELNRKMLALEKGGTLTEQEYNTYKQLIDVVRHIQAAREIALDSSKEDAGWLLVGDAVTKTLDKLD